VVVCSRTADYEALTNRLQLGGAVVIQPLSREQVDAYLAQAGPEMDAVRRVLEDDEKLRRLVTGPLMLNVVALAYRGMAIDDIPQFDTLAGRRRHLFDTYIERMIGRRGDADYSVEDTRRYLSVVAARMSDNADSMFHIEDMQPRTWLRTPGLRWSFRLGLLLLVIPLTLALLSIGTAFIPLLLTAIFTFGGRVDLFRGDVQTAIWFTVQSFFSGALAFGLLTSCWGPLPLASLCFGGASARWKPFAGRGCAAHQPG